MHPVAFQVGSFAIHWYGILVAAGFLAGLWTASRRALHAGIQPASVMDLGTWLIVGGMVGGRLWYVVAYWAQDFAGRPWTEVLMIRQGGLVYYGGFLGALLGGLAFALWKRLPFWSMADVFAPSVALGHAFGRMGCLMTGCCYGEACSWPWAVRFPADHASGGTPVHPTQLYEATLNVLLYAVLARWYPRRRFKGQIFAAYLVGYALVRLGVEEFRGDYAAPMGGTWLTSAQWVSVVWLCAGIAVWLAGRSSAPPAKGGPAG
jgi:phosphatidylglycerol:prolipoprotein diacylglycerol transferase